MDQTYLVSVEVPKWVTPAHFKVAGPLMKTTIDAIRVDDESMRGYLHAANLDGFPVKAGLAKGRQLEEICIRAFWWSFEQIMSGRKLPHER